MRLLCSWLFVLAIPSPAFATPHEGGVAGGAAGLPRLLPFVQVMYPKCTILDDERMYFDYGKFTIKPIAYPTLDEWIRTLKTTPGITRLLIAGHTDSSEPDAMELSWQRTAAVVNYLLEHGIEPRRLKLEAYGFQFPRVPNDTPDNRAGNRRVEFLIFEQDGTVKPRPRPTCRIKIDIQTPPPRAE